MGFIDDIKSWILRVWDSLKKLVRGIVNFFRDLLGWFQVKYNEVVRKHPRVDAVAVKIEDLKRSGNYSTYDAGLKGKKTVAKTFYDLDQKSIIPEYTEIVFYDDLDEETKRNFAGKDMLILN